MPGWNRRRTACSTSETSQLQLAARSGSVQQSVFVFRAPKLDSDPRLDPYRQRTAALSIGRTLELYMWVDTWTVKPGPWARWRRKDDAPREAILLYLRSARPGDGFDTDAAVYPDEIETELRAWSAGWIRYAGQVYRLRWISDDEAWPVLDGWVWHDGRKD